jgi:hypothetical protein
MFGAAYLNDDRHLNTAFTDEMGGLILSYMNQIQLSIISIEFLANELNIYSLLVEQSFQSYEEIGISSRS